MAEWVNAMLAELFDWFLAGMLMSFIWHVFTTVLRLPGLVWMTIRGFRRPGRSRKATKAYGRERTPA